MHADHEGVQVALDLVRVEHHVHQEALDADHLVPDRPWAIDLAHDGDVRIALTQKPDRPRHGRHRRALDEVVRHLDLLRLLDREPRRRRPVVLLGPLRLAAQGVRLELRMEDRHDGVHVEHVVSCRSESGHQLGVEVRFGEWRLDQVHHLDRHDRTQCAGRDPVDMSTIDRRQEAPARGHPLSLEWVRDFSDHLRRLLGIDRVVVRPGS